MRTPLTTLGLSTDRLEDEMCSSGSIAVIRSQLARLERLGDQLRALPAEIVPLPVVDLVGIARLATNRLRPVAEWEHVSLRLHTIDCGQLRGDADEVENALANIIENAIKHSPRGETVDITVSASDDELVVEVADHGPGIHPDCREIVLQPGVRLVGEHPVAGTGQGLTIVADTVARLHGRLEIVDPPRPGTLVRIVFPAARRDPGES